MKKRKLLIATTNKGKLKEIKSFLEDLPFEFISLEDLDEKIPEPEETEAAIEGNAILKAKYYGKKTGLLTLADDGGIFIDALDGWPGVESARVADTSDEQCRIVLEKMKNIEQEKRTASFELTLALYNPEEKTTFLARGITEGRIAKKAVADKVILHYGYNRLFIVGDIGKTYSEMTVQEKNAVSHRGKALIKIKYFLENQYRGKHFVVPLGLIVENGKVLMNKRNDPHNPEFHKVWEFPGGSVEMGETLEENLVREAKEETGLEVEPVQRLYKIRTKTRPKYNCQVYLFTYVCKVVGGELNPSDAEVLESKWYDPDEIPNLKLFSDDGNFIKEILPELKEVIKNYKL